MATISYQEAKDRLPNTHAKGVGWTVWAVAAIFAVGAASAYAIGEIHGSVR